MTERMYAIVRDSTFDPAKLAHGKEKLDQFQVLHASQPGYRGNILIDAGEGRMLILTLWDDQEAAMAGRSVLGPEVDRLLGSLMTAESHVVGTGSVLATDIVFKRSAPLKALFQRACELGGLVGGAERTTQLFGRRIDRRYQDKLQTVLEQRDAGHPSCAGSTPPRSPRTTSAVIDAATHSARGNLLQRHPPLRRRPPTGQPAPVARQAGGDQ
jgi:hypothetical protein